MTFKNFRIGTRLGAAFTLVLLMLILVAITGLTNLAHLRQSMEQITRGNTVEANLASTMHLSVADRMIALRNIVLLSDQQQMQAQVERVARQAARYDDATRKLDAAFAQYGLPADEAAMVAELKQLSSTARPLIDKVQALGLEHQTGAASALLIGDLRTVQRQWEGKLDALAESERVQNEAALAASDAAYGTAQTIMLGLSAAALLCGLALAWFITRGITRPIKVAVQVAQAVAAGDLTSKIAVTSRDETGILLTALQHMNESLIKIVTEVRNSTDTISISSREIADGNMDLSSRTEDQAGSLEETASSMEEMTATVRQNADNALQGNQLAVLAKETASKGGAVIAKVVATMEEINDASQQIEDIVGVIDGIAFQTNILALNAAVEAARAGEQGRGFAVVASEVRQLAQRSATAAKEIKTMIGASVAKVASGSQLVDQAGRTMDEVVASVSRVTAIMHEITSASQEQWAGIEQINQAVITMDNVTQQNAALVEQSAAAAQSLQDQSVHLEHVVGRFMLAASAPSAGASIDTSSPARPPRPARRAPTQLALA